MHLTGPLLELLKAMKDHPVAQEAGAGAEPHVRSLEDVAPVAGDAAAGREGASRVAS